MLTYLGMLGGKLLRTENTDPSGRNRPCQTQSFWTNEQHKKRLRMESWPSDWSSYQVRSAVLVELPGFVIWRGNSFYFFVPSKIHCRGNCIWAGAWAKDWFLHQQFGGSEVLVGSTVLGESSSVKVLGYKNNWELTLTAHNVSTPCREQDNFKNNSAW